MACRLPLLPLVVLLVSLSSSNLVQGIFKRRAGVPYLTPTTQIVPVCAISGARPNILISNSGLSSRVWKGWGASLSWWANYIGSLSAAQQKQVLDLLFSKTRGLGLNIVRYNIGGGFSPTLSPQFLRPEVKWRGIPGFKPLAGSAYNWSADPFQRSILASAKARGANRFIAFSKSPPFWMTISGDVAGNVLGAPNLKTANIALFADYLTSVVQHFATSFNVKFNFLEPFNQPSNKWKKGGTQEGCSFSGTQISALLPALLTSLKLKTLKTSVAAFNDYPANLPGYASAVSAAAVRTISQIHTHAYESTKVTSAARPAANARDYALASNTSARLGKELWVTEWGPNGASGSDLGVALYMSRIIVESINYLRASAWLYWQPVDASPVWRLLNVNWNVTRANPWYRPIRTKKFWALFHFTKTVPPGSIPVNLASANNCNMTTVAFYNPCARQLVFFAVNQQSSDFNMSVSISGFKKARGGVPSTRQSFRTSATENFFAGNLTAVNLSGTNRLTLKGQSLTTLVIGNVMSRITTQNTCVKLT